MKSIKNSAAQGDVIFRRVAKIPDGAVEQSKKGGIIVAHSETGHHHIAEPAIDGAVTLFSTQDPLVSYLRVSGEHTDIVHHRPYDTHETLRLLSDGAGETIWEIGRQREYTPEGWRRVED